MDDKYGRKGRVSIFDVNGNSFIVELLKIWVTRVARSSGMNHRMKKRVIIEISVVVETHKQAVTRFVLEDVPSLRRNPIASPQVSPLSLS